MAPRSIWNGTITLGLVNVPIKLYSAIESKTMHFSEVHANDGAQIEHRRICPKEDKEVDYDEVVKGYEVSPDRYVVLEKNEIKAAAGDRGKVVHLTEFVDAGEIDPVFFDKSCVRDCALTLSTMLFHDEVRPTRPILTGGKKPARKQLDQAIALIEALSADWAPENYEDCYRERLRRVIEDKRKRRTIEEPEPENEPPPAPDLMEALQRALDNVNAGRDVRADGDGSANGDGNLDELSRHASWHAPRKRTSAGAPRCPRSSWSTR